MPKYVDMPPNLPPRLLPREVAAAYVNLSPTTFDAEVKAGRMPAPKLITARRRAWDRLELDAVIDRLLTDGASPEDATWNDIDAPQASTVR